MKRSIGILSLSVASLALSGCLQTRAELRGPGQGGSDPELQAQTRAQQAQQQQRQQISQTVASTLGDSSPAKPTVQTPPKPLPPASRFDEIDDQFRQLNGRIEVLESQLAQLSSPNANEKEVLEKKALNDKLLAYEEALKKLQDQVHDLQAARMVMQSSDAREAAVGEPKKSGAPGAAGNDVYQEGEALFKNKRWKDAIVTFSKYRDQFPKGKNYADATYKIGVCFQELGMKDESKPFLEEVVAKFPKSREATKAAFRLKAIK